MADTNVKPKRSKFLSFVLTSLHIVVLIAAALLIFIITRDTFENVSFISDPQYLKFQFWICLIFMFDIIVDFIFVAKTWTHRLLEVVFFILCVPFVNVINYYGIHVSGEIFFVLRLLPMLRATYIIVQVTSTLKTDTMTNLFKAYIILFVVVVYFSSLMFYVEEHPVNQGVDTYWSALWWTIMTLTTAGCYITEVTTVGKILSVVLSGGGLILFPVFTVYVANAVNGTSSSSDSDSQSSSDNQSQTSDDKKQSENSDEAGNNANFANANQQSSSTNA
ncbi:MAG: potassium channel family protein [Muribaculaceae bacterium]|nr:potassium channel family protein [Muribaculaceae bacterium]